MISTVNNNYNCIKVEVGRRYPVDNFGTVVGENPDCLLLSGTVVGENPDHVCWVEVQLKETSEIKGNAYTWYAIHGSNAPIKNSARP